MNYKHLSQVLFVAVLVIGFFQFIPTKQITYAQAGSLVSDDFNSCTLDSGLWTYVDPVGDATMSLSGEGVILSLPAGTTHDTWGSNAANFSSTVPRIRQNVSNTDFEMVVKFDGPLSASSQMEGILIEQDENDMLRLEFLYARGKMRSYAASFTEGAADQKYNRRISNSTPLYMKVTRVGDTWTQSYSSDGIAWKAMRSFTHAMTANAVSVYAGNGNAANDVTIDYVFNSANPITPEDATVHTVAVTMAGNGTVSKSPDQASYACGDQVTLTATPDPGWAFSSWSGAISGSANPETITIVDGTQNVTATFVDTGSTTYTLSTNVVGNGTVTKSPDQATYTAGTVVTLTPVADPGWQFSSWSGDASGSANPLVVTIDADKNISATFTQIPPTSYTLTVTAVGNGIVTKNPDQTTYNAGEVVTLTAAADAGWAFSGWSGDSNGSANPLLVTMDGDKSITATFAQIPPASYTLTVTTVGNGNVTKNPDQTTYNAGEVVTLTAAADAGWVFSGWSGDASGSANPLLVTMDADKSIIATFTVASPASSLVSDDFNSCTLNNSLWTFENPAGDGTLTLTGEAAVLSVPEGTTHDTWGTSAIDFSSTVPRVRQTVNDADFEMVVKFDGALTDNQWEGILVGQDENDMLRLEFLFIGGNMNAFVASFTEGAADTKYNQNITNSALLYMKVSRVEDTWTQSYSSDGLSWTDLNSFMHAMTVNAISVYAGNGGVANDVTIDYVFNSASPISPEDATVIAHTLDLTMVGNGTVNKSPDQVTYACSEEVTLTAVPDNGWAFSDWSGDASGSTNPLAVTMDADKNITATFVEPGPGNYTLTVNTVGNGSVTKSPDQATYNAGEVVTLTPVADAGWTFSSWSGDASGSANPLAVTMDGDKSITATFTQIPPASYTLTVTTVGNGNVTKNPDQTTYTAGEVVTLTPAADASWAFSGWSGDASGSANPLQVTMDGDKSITATFNQVGPPVIDVWYGTSQTFGQPGDAQKWVNILGNVSDVDGTVSSLEYTLNGGPPVTLSIGPDDRRLALPGDFNIDLDRADLIDGQNDVAITATDNDSNTSVTTVTVNYDSSSTWPLPYSIDWSTVSNLQDVVQVVDGHWDFTSSGARLMTQEDVDYDRVLAIGDFDWTDYEITVPLTVHWIDPDGYQSPSVSPGFGITLRWQGHTDSPVVCPQPHCGWTPSGAGAWYDIGRDGPLSLSNLDDTSVSINVGDTYYWKMRVETIDGNYEYSVKVWESGQAEPANWNLTKQIGSNGISNGSAIVIAHEVDMTVGDVTVVPLGQSNNLLTLNTIGNGSVTADPDKSSYNLGEQVTLTAVPDAGWAFSGWSGDASGSANPLVVTMDADKSITAAFSLPDTTAPTRPTGLTATAVSSARVDLTWEASTDPESGISHYLIYRDGASIDQSSTNSYIDLSVASESTYSYEVSAVNNQLLESVRSTAVTTTTPATSNSLIAHWALNETTGGIAPDSSGNSHEGTLVNGPIWTAGYENNGLDFDGSNDYVEVDAVPFDFASWSAMSVAAWVRNDVGVGAGTDDIISHWNYPSSRGWVLTHHGNNQYFWEIDGKGAISGGTVSTNWTHVVATYDGATGFMRLYVGGVEVANLGGLSGNLPASTANLLIATQQDGANYFDGTIDDVRIYNEALSAQEVQALFNQSDTTPPTRSNGSPSGILPAGMTEATLSLSTDETATCKYGINPNTEYAAMVDTFSSTNSTSHSQLITGLSDGGAYNYYVRCIDGNDNSNTDDYHITFTVAQPDATAPTRPTDLAATAVSSARVDLSWTASTDPESGISHYLVYRNGINIEQSTTNSYIDTSVVPSSTYTYEVSAVNNQLLESGLSTAVTTTTPAAPSSLIAHWALNETTGVTASDSSGNNHEGALVNGPIWTTGYENNGLDFDGSNDYVEVDAAPFDFASWSAMSVAAWVRNDVGVGAGTDDIISYWNYPSSRSWVLTHHWNNQYFWEIGGKGAISGGTVSSNWAHVVATYDGATGFMRLYVDGVEVANLGGLSGNLPASTANLLIAGQQDGSNYFDGTIDDVRIYNQALSAQEVQDLFSSYP